MLKVSSKGSSATNGATKFLKPKRNIRGERKTKEHTRKLQAPPQLLDIVVGNTGRKNGAINQLLNGAGGYDEADVEDLPGGTTTSVVVADVNKDGFEDIIIGNYVQAINCSLTMEIIHSLIQFYQEEICLREVLPLLMWMTMEILTSLLATIAKPIKS